MPPTQLPVWPQWPQISTEGLDLLVEVVQHGPWAISGRSRGLPLQNTLFEREFASHTGREWCVTLDHGTSALVASLTAIGVKPHDSVLVPALTWVACATAVLRVGAIPILVDVDPMTLCVTGETLARAAIRTTTAAIVVHLACTAANMDEIMSFSHATGITIVEDCAQSHGARWANGASVGTHAELATYSFQDTKALTCGEGGCVVGDDPDLYERLQSLRADSRTLSKNPPPSGSLYLSENGTIMGTNFGLSEPSAALVRVALRSLNAQVEQKEAAASLLDAEFSKAGIRTIRKNPQLSTRSVYEYGIFVPPSAGDIGEVSETLTRVLNTSVYRMDPPIHLSPLYHPQTNPSLAPYAPIYRRGDFPVAESSWATLLMLHHSVLLAPLEQLDGIPAAAIQAFN